METKYNYVFFNFYEGKGWKLNRDGYYSICLRDLEEMAGVEVVPKPLYHKNLFLKILYSLHNTPRLNRFVDLPLKNLWYPYYFNGNFAKKKPVCIVVISRDLPFAYLDFIKKKHPDYKLVLLHRDKIEVCDNYRPGLSFYRAFDLVMSYDTEEAKKFNIPHFDEIESKIELRAQKQYQMSDVFFAGKAKDRMPKILKAYDILTKAGLKCFFYIVDANVEDQVQRDGIIYTNKPLSYIDMLNYSMATSCLLELCQSGQVGYTSRFLESVIYNKLLITENMSVKDSKFFKTGFIQCIETVDDIDPQFVSEKKLNVDYKYNNEFSPVNLIKKIDKLLK